MKFIIVLVINILIYINKSECGNVETNEIEKDENLKNRNEISSTLRENDTTESITSLNYEAATTQNSEENKTIFSSTESVTNGEVFKKVVESPKILTESTTPLKSFNGSITPKYSTIEISATIISTSEGSTNGLLETENSLNEVSTTHNSTTESSITGNSLINFLPSESTTTFVPTTSVRFIPTTSTTQATTTESSTKSFEPLTTVPTTTSSKNPTTDFTETSTNPLITTTDIQTTIVHTTTTVNNSSSIQPHTETSITDVSTTTSTATTTIAPDCYLISPDYILSSNNILNVTWNTNGSDNLCITNRTSIYLKNLDCEENCPSGLNTTCLPDKCEPCIMSCTFFSGLQPVLNKNYQFPTPLSPCRNYQVVVVYRGIVTYLEKFFTNKNEAYRNATNITAIEDFDGENVINLTVNWNYELKCPQDFKVYLIDGESSKEVEVKNGTSNSLTASFTNITACTNYTIKVSTIRTNLDSLNATISYESQRILPSEIRDFNITTKIDSNVSVIEVKWENPIYGAKCIKSYNLIAESLYENRSVFVEGPTHQFTNVVACAHYNITIKTSSNETQKDVTVKMSSSTSSPVNVLPNSHELGSSQTLPIIAHQNVFTNIPPPNFSDVTDTSFKLSVVLNNDRNKCTISKYFFTCNGTSNFNVTKDSKEPNVTFTGLEPYTEFLCSVKVENQAGISDYGFSNNERTKEGYPDAPRLQIINTTVKSREFGVQWEKPANPRGPLKYYKILIKFNNYSYENPPYCQHDPNDNEFDVILHNLENRSYVFEKALPASRYIVSIQASNGEDKEGPWSGGEPVMTLPDKSDPVNLTVYQNEPKLNVPYNNTAVLQWEYPCRANGNLSWFEIRYRKEFDDQIVKVAFNSKQYRYEHGLTLDAIHSYNFTIFPFSIENIAGNEANREFKFKPGIPDSSYVDTLVNAIKLDSTAKEFVTFTSVQHLFNSTVGKIEEIIFLVHQTDCTTVSRKRNLVGFDDINDIPFWLNASHNDCIRQYQAIKLRNPSNIIEDTIKLGSAICTNKNELCNGPLKSGTKYSLTLRFYTETGFTDSAFLNFTTDKQTPIVAIIISFLVIMGVVFIIGFYITYKKPRNQTDNQYDRKDVPVQNFHEFHSDMIKNDNEKIREEYKAIQFFSEGLDKTTLASKVNEKYNRYANISPFDSNRVVLNDDEFENDYINASFVNGYYYAKEYIAAQGPKPNTSHDFWRMVLQYKTESIVMLTSLVENNKVKCHEYFPKLNGRVKFDNIQIVCTSEQKYPNYIKRILEVEKDDIKHTVKHYYFLKWMDHSACNASDLIDFVKIVRNERKQPSETFIVHCSAGVGRTGTFIAVDILMQRIKQERKVNIFDLVKQLRKQRMKMVQTFDQYALVYNAALEMTTVRVKRPRVLQNITMYIENIELFKNLTRRGNLRDGNEGRANRKVDDKESAL